MKSRKLEKRVENGKTKRDGKKNFMLFYSFSFRVSNYIIFITVVKENIRENLLHRKIHDTDVIKSGA